MKLVLKQLPKVLLFGVLLFFTNCGIVSYPGQPGVATNGYSKINTEDLEEEGLYVYEVTYDNRQGKPGVAAIVTKLYPGAKTYTSNVRTNADGTLYFAKGQYNGAEVQMISLPQQNQVIMPPQSTVQFFTGYLRSLDEVDDRNIIEENIFKKSLNAPLSQEGFANLATRWQWLKLASLTTRGTLSYHVTSLEIDKENYTPAEPVTLETDLYQHGFRSNMNVAQKKDFANFLETKFPKGFNGEVKIHVKDSDVAIPMKLSLHTPKTAAASGIKVTRSAELLKSTLDSLK
jgi:hypothetical protein